MVEQYHRRPVWREQGPGDAVFGKQLRQLVVHRQYRLGIAFEERIAVELGPAVDKGLDAVKDQVAAEIIIVEYRALDVSGSDRGECRRRTESARRMPGPAGQEEKADRQQQGAGKRDPA